MEVCSKCRKPIDKPVLAEIDGERVPVVISIKTNAGVYHYGCWVTAPQPHRKA